MKSSASVSITKLKEKCKGRAIKVAVIDTGIESSHSIFRDKNIIAGGIVLNTVYDSIKNERIEESDYDGLDLHGHGTAVASIIHSIAEEASIYSIRILDEKKTSKIGALLYAISWALKHNIDIINLSLGNIDLSKSSDFNALLKEAYEKNIIIVSSDNNLMAPSLPASFPSVVSVEAIKTTDKYEFHYRKNNIIEFLARGEDIEVSWKGDTIKKVSGNSFAAAHITGFVALLKEYKKDINCNQIKTTLQEMAASNRKHKYDVYISYSCKEKNDEDWGNWLVNNLKKYKIKYNHDTKIYKNTNDYAFSKNRDSHLSEEMEKALLSSEYLIVVYSKDIIDNKRIEEEVNKFSQKIGSEFIIFIQLDQLSTDVLEKYINKSKIINAIPEYKRTIKEIRSGVIKNIVMTIFSCSEEEFYIIKLKQINKVRVFIYALVASSFLIFALLLHNYFRTTVKYYSTFVYQYSIPKGICAISVFDISSKNTTYKFEYKMGKVIKVSLINSHKMLIDNEEGISVWIPSYSTDDRILRIRNENKYGDVVYFINYSDDLQTIEFVDKKNRLHSRKKNDFISTFFVLEDKKDLLMKEKENPITLLDVQHDENGYLSKELYFRDKNNNIVSDENGCYGKIFEVSSDGLIEKESWLDKNYNIFAYISYKYDKYGNKTEIAKYNTEDELIFIQNKYAIIKYEYDKNLNLIKITFFDKKNNKANDVNEISEYRFDYDENGNMIKRFIYDTEGQLLHLGDIALITVYNYDKYGRMIYKGNFDANGGQTKTVDNIHYTKYEYSDDNLKIKYTFYDENEEKTENNRGVSSVSTSRKYENNYILLAKKNFDINNNIINSKIIAPIENKYYNEFNNIIKREYLNADNSYFSLKDVAYTLYEYDNYKRNNKIIDYNKDNEIIRIEVIEYSPIGLVESKKYFKNDNIATDDNFVAGKTLVSKGTYTHKIKWLYDDYGNTVAEFYYNTNNKPHINKHGFHGITNAYNSDGLVSLIRYLDTQGDYIEIEGLSGYNMYYDSDGRFKAIEYFDKNNDKSISKNAGYHKMEHEYSENGLKTSELYFDTKGNILLNKKGYAGYKRYYENDGRFNIISTEYLGKDGKPTMVDDGYAYKVVYNDSNGDERAVHYLDLIKKPIMTKYGYSSKEVEENGIIEKYYDENGFLIIPNL